MKRLATILLLSTMTIGCPGFGSETLEPEEGIVTWESDVRDILTRNCGGCHVAPPANGAPSGFVLTEYNRADTGDTADGAFEKSDRIIARAVMGTPGFMPPGSTGLSTEEQSKLLTWVASGAPRTEAEVTP